ncbi:MAG: hypothetical protein WD096_09970 [Actinomycetota bacterium]
MSRRRNLPLTEAQLRRYSPATVASMFVVSRRVSGTDARAWLQATAVGGIVAPDGTMRDLRAGEQPYLRGVLLTFEHREQLRRMENVSLRTYQDRVTRWVAARIAHRCTGDGHAIVTLFLDPKWLPGDPCPWIDCPRSSAEFGAEFPRPERGDTASPARSSRVEIRDADSVGAGTQSEQGDPSSTGRGVTASKAGMQRGETGTEPALDQIKKVFDVSEVVV